MTAIREWIRRNWLVPTALLAITAAVAVLALVVDATSRPAEAEPTPLTDADALVIILDRCDDQPANLEPATAAQLRQLCIVDVASEVLR